MDTYHRAYSSHCMGRALWLGLMIATLSAAQCTSFEATHNATAYGAIGPGGWSVSPSGKYYRLAPAPEAVEVGKLSTYFECAGTCGPDAWLACLDSELDAEFLSAEMLGPWKARLPSAWMDIPLSAHVFVDFVNRTAHCSSRRATSSPLRTPSQGGDSAFKEVYALTEIMHSANGSFLFGYWMGAYGRAALVGESAHKMHLRFSRSFCICERGMTEQLKYRAVSDHYHWSPLHSSMVIFFLPMLLASLAPCLIAGACLACTRSTRRPRRSADAPHLEGHQAQLGQVLEWIRPAGVLKTKLNAMLICTGWSLVVVAITPNALFGSESVTLSPAFWERVGYCEYYWALFPWGVLLMTLALRPIDAVAIQVVSVLIFVATLGSGAYLVVVSVRLWQSQVIDRPTAFRCYRGDPTRVPTHWPFVVAHSVGTIIVCACPLLLYDVCQCWWRTTVMAHSLAAHSHGGEHLESGAHENRGEHLGSGAHENRVRPPRVQLRRLWLTVRLILLAAFSGLLGGLLNTACRNGTVHFFWQQPPSVKPAASIWDYYHGTSEERWFPKGQALSLEQFPRWLFHVPRNMWTPNTEFLLATNSAAAQLLACCSMLLAVITSGASNRGRVLQALHRLLHRYDSVRRAVLIATFVGESNLKAVMMRAADNFRVIELSAVTPEVLTGHETRTSTARHIELFRADAFISHTHTDDPEARWQALQAWTRSRGGRNCAGGGGVSMPAHELLVWLDRVSLNQCSLEKDLQCLPLYVLGCKEMLALVGPNFCARLWVRCDHALDLLALTHELLYACHVYATLLCTIDLVDSRRRSASQRYFCSCSYPPRRSYMSCPLPIQNLVHTTKAGPCVLEGFRLAERGASQLSTVNTCWRSSRVHTAVAQRSTCIYASTSTALPRLQTHQQAWVHVT